MVDAAVARPHRRAMAALLAAFALAVAGVAAGEWFEWPFLRAPLERFLSRSLDRPVALGPAFGVRLIGSVRLHSDRLTIAGLPAVANTRAAPLIDAQDARLVLPYATLLQLWRGQHAQPPYVEALSVARLELNLTRDAQGLANWQFGAPAANAEAQEGVVATLPRIGSLLVSDGQVRLDDALQKLSIDATLRTREGMPAGAAPAPIAASASASASAVQNGLEVRGTGRWRAEPLTLTFQSTGILPLAQAGGATDVRVPIRLDLRAGRSRLLIDGSAADLLHLGALDGRFELAGPSLAAIGDALGVTLPTTAVFTMNGQVRKNGGVWAAAVRTLQIGTSRLAGDFRYDTGPAVPMLSGTLTGARLALADLGPAVGANTAAAPVAQRGGRVLPQREFDIPSLRAMNADVALRLDVVDLGTPQLAPLAPLQGRLHLQDGVLDIGELLARTADGELRGAVSVDARPPMPLWRADVRWSGIELARFVKARNPRDVQAQPAKAPARAASAPAQPGYVSGVLAGAAKVQGEGKSMAAMLATLDGSARLWVRDGRISHLLVELAGLDVAQSLGLLVVGDDALPMRCAVAQLRLTKGRAVPDVAIIDTGDSTLLASGSVSLADESLALTLTARPHDFSPLTLRAPLHVEGSFAQPAVRLDKSALGWRLAGAAALAVLTPAAALLALVDVGEDDHQRCQEVLVRTQRAPAEPGRRAASAGRP